MKSVIKAFSFLTIILLAFSLAQSVSAATIIVSCPFGTPGGDDLTRAFYVTSYPGSNLATVHLQYDANPAGTYTISLTPRLGAFNGPIIGSTQTVTVSLPSISSEADVTFHFGGAAVTPGSTVTFTQAQISGPGTAYFNTGSGTCSGVFETNGTTPPLDTVRRNSVGVEISELSGASTDWAVTFVSMTPQAPQAGQPVIFRARLVALSTTGSYPQSVNMVCTIDGNPCGSGSVSYPGPTGNPAVVTAATPWPATPGTHVLTWAASTVGDPNPSNNVMSITFTVVPQAPFDFSISASPTQQNVAPIGTASYTITVNPVSGSPQNVALSITGAPPGVSTSLNPTFGAPPFTSILSVTTTSSVTPGTITLTITGIGGGTTQSTQVSMIVSQAPDFSIDASPPSQSTAQGQTASYTVHVAALNGFNSPVSLTVSGAPSGANAVLSVTSATPDFDSALTITLPADVPTGTYTLTVTGTGGGLSHQVNLVLTISASAPTQTATQTIQTSSTQSPTSTDLVGMLQQNGLLLLVVGLVLVLVVAVVAFGSRRKQSPQPTPTAAGTVYCSKCGTPNPATNEFCGKCGNKIR